MYVKCNTVVKKKMQESFKVRSETRINVCFLQVELKATMIVDSGKMLCQAGAVMLMSGPLLLSR